MAQIVAEFFGIIGVDMTPPETMAELIPYLLTVLIGCLLVAGVFKVLSSAARALSGIRRF